MTHHLKSTGLEFKVNILGGHIKQLQHIGYGHANLLYAEMQFFSDCLGCLWNVLPLSAASQMLSEFSCFSQLASRPSYLFPFRNREVVFNSHQKHSEEQALSHCSLELMTERWLYMASSQLPFLLLLHTFPAVTPWT